MTLTPLLPLGITFVNANYEVRPANANTVGARICSRLRETAAGNLPRQPKL